MLAAAWDDGLDDADDYGQLGTLTQAQRAVPQCLARQLGRNLDHKCTDWTKEISPLFRNVDLKARQHLPNTSLERVSCSVFRGSKNSGCSAMALFGVEISRHGMVEREDNRRSEEER